MKEAFSTTLPQSLEEIRQRKEEKARELRSAQTGIRNCFKALLSGKTENGKNGKWHERLEELLTICYSIRASIQFARHVRELFK